MGKYDYRGLSLNRNSYTLDEVAYLKHQLKIHFNAGRQLTYIRILTCLNQLGIDYDEDTGTFTETDGRASSGFSWDCFV